MSVYWSPSVSVGRNIYQIQTIDMNYNGSPWSCFRCLVERFPRKIRRIACVSIPKSSEFKVKDHLHRLMQLIWMHTIVQHPGWSVPLLEMLSKIIFEFEWSDLNRINTRLDKNRHPPFEFPTPKFQNSNEWRQQSERHLAANHSIVHHFWNKVGLGRVQ